MDSSVQASLVVGVDNVTHNDLATANTAVVRTLTVKVLVNMNPNTSGKSRSNIRSRVTTGGPAERLVVVVEQSVLLLETEPGLVVGISLHHLVALMAEVELVGSAIGVPALSKNDDVGRATEGIRVDGTRTQVDVRVVAGSLLGRGAVEVPNGKIFRLVVLLGKSLQETITVSVSSLNFFNSNKSDQRNALRHAPHTNASVCQMQGRIVTNLVAGAVIGSATRPRGCRHPRDDWPAWPEPVGQLPRWMMRGGLPILGEAGAQAIGCFAPPPIVAQVTNCLG